MKLGTRPGENSLPGATSTCRRTVAWLALASLAPIMACGRGAPAGTRRPASASLAIAQVHLRDTTDAELRSVLGDPDEQAADGSLVYRFAGARRSGTETVHFQFDHGKLSKICRSRS